MAARPRAKDEPFDVYRIALRAEEKMRRELSKGTMVYISTHIVNDGIDHTTGQPMLRVVERNGPARRVLDKDGVPAYMPEAEVFAEAQRQAIARQQAAA